MRADSSASSTFSTVITDYSAVDRIINHLKLTFAAERPPQPQVAQQLLYEAVEARTEYLS